MQAEIKNLSLTVPGALEAAQKLRAWAIIAGVSETILYLQRVVGLLSREG